MTDVRDPEPRTVLESPDDPVLRRPTLVARALSPILRVTGRDLAGATGREIQLRDHDSFELKPKFKFHYIRWSLFIVIVLPTLVAGIYLFAFASDQYVAEAKFAVRQAEALQGTDSGDSLGSSSSSNQGSGGQGAAPSASSMMSGTVNLGGQDAEILTNYIHSRAIIDDVSHRIDLRSIFQRPEADFWARLPKDASAEDMTRYWKRMVTAYLEASSGIVTVSVSAFRREDALKLTDAILESSEALVNTLSVKIRMDMMKTAQDEVVRSEGQVQVALTNLTSFRNARHDLDPLQSSQSLGKLLLTLMTDKIDAEGHIFVAQRVQGPNAPGMASLKDKLQSINDHIKQIKAQMAGDKAVSSNMAATLAQFEGLELKKQFAETMYRFASNGVERARITSERQQIYLAVFEPPSLPQDYTYPLRWSDTILVAVGMLMIWIVGATIIASVNDHRL